MSVSWRGEILICHGDIYVIWEWKDFIKKNYNFNMQKEGFSLKKKGIMILKFNIKDFMYLYLCGRILFRTQRRFFLERQGNKN